jgi:AcrR family transcriptional regulator
MHSQQDRALRLLWGVETATNRGPKARWTPEDIATAAVELADEGGLEAVSLARVAARLGMTTTAVYRYADSKATLVELMVDVAVGEAPASLDPDWRQACRAWARLLAGRYAAHPWLSDLKPSGMPRQPRVYGWIDALVRAIPGDTGVDPLRLALLLDGLVRAHAGLERGLREAEPLPWLGDAVAARYPALAAAPARDVSDARDELDFALDVVLRGVTTEGSVRNPSPPSPRP